MPVLTCTTKKTCLRALPWAIGAVICSLGAGVVAQPAPQSQAPQGAGNKVVLVQQLPVGQATRQLLEMQARGTRASDRQYPMPVAVAEKVYQRYVDSFSHPIPEKLGSAMEHKQ